MRSSRHPRLQWTDHKTVGLQYGVTAAVFLLCGFGLMLLFRWQLAWPGRPLPAAAAALFGSANLPGGYMVPEFYNQLVAMHGTVMIFLAVVPLLVGAFGNYLVPLHIGARDMVFPRLNAASYWVYLTAGLCMLGGFFADGGAANSGWTSYPPLAVIATRGQDFWLVGIVLLGVSSTLNAVTVITTIVQARADGLTFMRLPFFVWAQLVAALLLLLAFPALQIAGVLQLMDRWAGTSFFLPSGLVVGGVPLEGPTGGGNPLLWQHLFWFLAHPEVYVLVLPAMGIVSEIIPNNARRPLWGYRTMVAAVLFLGVMSLLVWAHHMFLTGMGATLSGFFQVTTMIISVPSVVLITALVLSLWGGSIRFTVPMLFALAFLPMFGIGGLTGLPLGLAASDVMLHDTYYVVGHFHYLVAPGTLFAIFGGVYYWYPKITGRRLHEGLGRLHFWGSLATMNAVFLPMFAMGLMGVNRRLFDAGQQYAHAQATLPWNAFMTWSAVLLGLFQIPFLVNLVWSRRRGAAAGDNPWEATTLEWTVPSPPPHGNFAEPPHVVRGAYEYSPPATPQNYLPMSLLGSGRKMGSNPYAARPDTGVSTLRLGIGLFLASDAMLMGSLVSAYVLLAAGAAAGAGRVALDGVVFLEAAALATTWLALRRASRAGTRSRRPALIAGAAAAVILVVVEAGAMARLLSAGVSPADHVLVGGWFVMMGAQALHAAAGALAAAWLVGQAGDPSAPAFAARLDATRLYWHLVAGTWLVVMATLWIL